jgi:esterase/lipase superfamily enzyme
MDASISSRIDSTRMRRSMSAKLGAANDAKTPSMAIVTSSSTSVKPPGRLERMGRVLVSNMRAL